MEDASTAKGQRLRLTCTECYRRKIKCDKTIPCNTCTKRGYANRCTREEDEAVSRSIMHASENSTTSHNLIRTLLHRVNQLEAQLLSNAEHVGPDESVRSPPVLSCPPRSQGHDNRAATPMLAQPDPCEPMNSPIHEHPASAVLEDDDAATVLEFLAWGRNKDAEYGSTANQVSRKILIQGDVSLPSNALLDGSKQATFDLLEILLPDQTQIRQLVEYHSTHLLWYHGSYSAWIFNNDVEKFLDSYSGDIRNPDLDMQWLALLFAILTGSLACAPSKVRHAWGFGDTESSKLALQWYEACVSCLNTGLYIERHTINSVEAISTLTIAAHILGKSNSQSILLSSAGRIAQSLGLHRLSGETNIPAEQLRRREAGRHVFDQLCTQDWFQIPFSESYSLNPRFIKTDKPTNCNDHGLQRLPEAVPTQTSYCNYRYKVAALMPRLLDATSECNTLFTKYEQVLKYDEKMRKLATASMPTFLSTSATINADWPVWIGWARRSLAICAAHKIIMIHRRFLGLSFTNTAFSFTRRTCVAAAKTILKEALSANDQNGPILWIEQAFSVAAGIVLCLDIAHREPDLDDLDRHETLIERTIGYLRSFKASKIASRGAQLLSTLQKELQQGSFGGLGKRRHDDARTNLVRPTKQARTLHDTSRTSRVAVSQPAVTLIAHTVDSLDMTQESSAWDENPCLYPIDITLGTQGLFDDLLSFQF
ncbi:uncharacterized protein M421DRAFT_259978 [Didymella exigua CBS 183.55]|uniref:Zn(2)-C6 fungal-type domain-containing protein n=1 Tax=Didymella exigua CBS 183.55 TaxID=1150837 RepID=A0A6A5RD92_9PLEO|nr:uncharacterized protein M421DRAFT_259978 [Didymella exigua CBS 183.55]KAF1925359.1 hypothetical protein M421DRAFT_259978 [Didymella exigua CBS 183.55]